VPENRFKLGPEHAHLTLEERRAARKELLIRYIQENPDHARVIAMNTIAQYEAKLEQGRVQDRYQSDYAKVVKAVPNEVTTTTVNLPTVVKRSRTARLDSLIARLKDLPPALLEAKIREVQGEFFKQGMPVTYDDLKAVAAKYLNRRGVDRHYASPIQVTRT